MATIYANSTDGSTGATTSDWDGLHDSNRGKNAYFTDAHRDNAVETSLVSGDLTCYRVFMSFDTSGISVAPTSATLKVYGKANGTGDIILVKSTQASTDILAYNDLEGWTSGYDDGDLTAYSSEISTWSTSGYNDITLNATALSDMASLSTLSIAILNHTYDYQDTAPPGDPLIEQNGMYFTQETGTDKDPYIDYTAASEFVSAPFTIDSGILTVNGGVLTVE
tara:strand:+ start:234 stop:902 length:669 start_codon:yes stop_codon:yes gene_type:complete